MRTLSRKLKKPTVGTKAQLMAALFQDPGSEKEVRKWWTQQLKEKAAHVKQTAKVLTTCQYAQSGLTTNKQALYKLWARGPMKLRKVIYLHGFGLNF